MRSPEWPLTHAKVTGRDGSSARSNSSFHRSWLATGLPGCIAPPPPLPADPPLLFEAVDHVGRVADHVQGTGEGLEGPKHRGHFHPLIGAHGLAPAVRRPAVHRPRPPTR